MKIHILTVALATTLASVGAAFATFASDKKAQDQAAKPTIVLVHGAWADGTCWRRIIPLLEKDGYTVIAVQNPLSSLAEDVATTKRVIDAQKGPVVVVGHSYGGAVITGAAAGAANVRALIYLAAFAPDAAEPVAAYYDKYPVALAKALTPDAAGFLYIDRAKFHADFCADVPEGEARIMAAVQKPLAGAIFGQSVPVAAWKTIPSWYLVSQEDQAINPDLERFYAKRMDAHLGDQSEPCRLYLSSQGDRRSDREGSRGCEINRGGKQVDAMNDLLELAVAAHGGLNRWNALKAVQVNASITGAIWYVKGKPDVLKDVVITAQTHKEYLTMDFPGQDKRSIFEPHRIVMETQDGKVLQSRNEPIASFEGQQRETPWDDIHVAYFAGEALWTYLTTPFLYTYPGFVTEELTPWRENGEQQRRLKITFPDSVASHTREQISYFGPDGLLRRHDYTVDILGGATGANYASEYRDVGGVIVPTRRRIYAYEGDHNKVPEPLLVAIDMGEIAFS